MSKPDLDKNRFIKTPIARIEAPRKGGRTPKFTPTKLRNNINKYFEWCETNDRIPSLTGLAIHLKVTRECMYSWLRSEKFSELIEQARLRIQNWCEEDVYKTHGTMVPGKALYMKNVHNWSEKQTTDITQETTVKKVLTVEEAKQKLTSIAPLLLEQLKGQLLSQLALPKGDAVIIEGQEDNS